MQSSRPPRDLSATACMRTSDDSISSPTARDGQMHRRLLQENKRRKVQTWEKKTNRSPFLIDLLAEVMQRDQPSTSTLAVQCRALITATTDTPLM